MDTLDSLLDGTYDDATFHDSELLSFHLDFVRAIATFEFNLQCRPTAPGQQFSLQRGTLAFAGVCFYLVEAPREQPRPGREPSLWITADGPLPDPRVAVDVPADLPAGAFVHYLYSGSTNSFIVVGARSAAFRWRVRPA